MATKEGWSCSKYPACLWVSLKVQTSTWSSASSMSSTSGATAASLPSTSSGGGSSRFRFPSSTTCRWGRAALSWMNSAEMLAFRASIHLTSRADMLSMAGSENAPPPPYPLRPPPGRSGRFTPERRLARPRTTEENRRKDRRSICGPPAQRKSRISQAVRSSFTRTSMGPRVPAPASWCRRLAAWPMTCWSMRHFGFISWVSVGAPVAAPFLAPAGTVNTRSLASVNKTSAGLVMIHGEGTR
mmetsp:Transcript_21056/g.61432  ORF Transcript_21056/g.61432 Transcript_21056/m.61432 type:complete len:242 (+) Transcript_21056:157-882(+)